MIVLPCVALSWGFKTLSKLINRCSLLLVIALNFTVTIQLWYQKLELIISVEILREFAKWLAIVKI